MSLMAQRLAPGVTCRSPAVNGPKLASTRAARVVIARADPEVREGRAYREDDDTVISPGQASSSSTPAAAGSPLYADEVSAQQKLRPKSNMSKEMKQKLKQEYIGLGGAEGQAMGANYFLYIIVGIAFLAVLSWLTGAI